MYPALSDAKLDNVTKFKSSNYFDFVNFHLIHKTFYFTQIKLQKDHLFQFNQSLKSYNNYIYWFYQY